MTDYAIEINGITKSFDHKVVVDNISLKVKKGSIFGFLGSNGSGKTTTIRMICGLLTPTEGTGRCLDYDIKTQQDEIKNHIGYMPQKFSLYSGLTVQENFQFFAHIYQIPEPKKEIKKVMEDLELVPYKDIKAGNLSGGWKQRMTLGCSLLHKPSLLFLDEPTAGVDPKARKDFWDYLHKISRRDGTTILVTTHYMDEAEKCTDLAYINLGKLLYSGTTKELIPFSKVKTLVLIDADTEKQNKLLELIAKYYPKLLASIVNNDLRVSSSNLQLLDELQKKEREFHFKEVTPSFEEVFIGLMN
ncbi:ABC transporter ATP-binding protein [Legionella sp. km772]|uniref:ABC transporter ATP-binding protein n=1 Tax=Legionella sp. km772 TaxID=2498111 RepID=UPI000F8E486C|nr:ABC transporter ATP-binding protein [Legionella sp. km772]RUR12933.1 ABC transporter ATP-binding protein [Legionella sp. km772]